MIRIHPAFQARPEEAAIIGRLIVSFGEIEYLYSFAAAHCIGPWETVLKALYRLRQSSARIDAAETLMRDRCAALGELDNFHAATAAIRHCLKVRNQYAHSHWQADHGPGLYFADLEDAASRPNSFVYDWKHVDLELLNTQEAYFSFAAIFTDYLHNVITMGEERSRFPYFPAPPAQQPPSLYNSQVQYAPQWLTEDQKRLHIARVQEAEWLAHSPRRERRPPKPSARQAREAKMVMGKVPKP